MAVRRRLESWVSKFPWYRRQARKAHLVRELQAHLESEVEEQRLAGLSRDEATRAAHLALGNMVRRQEELREAWAPRWVGTLFQDLRYGVRVLLKAPGFTTTAVLTLAIGLAANTAIFSVIDGVLLKPLAYRNPSQLVAVQIFVPQLANKYPMIPVDPVLYRVWSREAKSLTGIAAATSQVVNLTGSGEPQQLNAAKVTPDMFTVLGVQPMLGRDFSTNSDWSTYGREVMLSYDFWRSRFQSDPEIVGRGIAIDGEIETVVGVLPPWFRFPKRYELSQMVGFGADDVQVYLPLVFGKSANGAGDFSYAAIARLKPDVGVTQASAELSAILRHDPAELGTGIDVQDARAVVVPLREMIVRHSALELWVLFGAVFAVLLIIAVNLATLALARATTREHEGAIRSALGASPGRLLRQSLTEMLFVGLAGGALGLILARWTLAALLAVAPAELPRLHDIHLDGSVLVFTLAISLLAGLLAGLLPALRTARSHPQDALRMSGGHTHESKAGLRVREVLIGSETALSFVLLAAAGLLLTSFVKLNNVPLGYSVDHILLVNLQPSSTEYTSGPQRTEFFRRALAAATALPGVGSAAAIDTAPLGGENEVMNVVAPGDTRPTAERPEANFRQVTPGLFRLLHIPLVEGRELTWADAREDDVVISAATAKTVWPGRDPIGETFHAISSKTGPEYHVVGVVGDTRSLSLLAMPGPMVYRLYDGASGPVGLTLLLRTQLPTSSLAPALRQAIWKIDPVIPIPQVRSMNEIVSNSLAPQRFETLLTTLFAASALLLACLGIYGVVSYLVVRRTQEMGLRMALGARTSNVYWLMLRQGLWPIVIGLMVGICSTLGLGHLAGSLLFNIRPDDPVILAIATITLLFVGAVASTFPARRATRITPSAALRLE